MSCGAVTSTVPHASFPSKEPKKKRIRKFSFIVVVSLFVHTSVRAKGRWFCASSWHHQSSHPLLVGRTVSLSRQWFLFPTLLTSPAGVLPVVPRLIACNLKHPGLQLKHTIYTFAGVSQFFGDSSHMLSLALRWAFSSLQSSSASPAPGTAAALWWLLGRPGVRSE